MKENNYTDEELVGLSREGDTLSTERLMSRYKPLVLLIAKSYFLSGGDRSDLIQEGMIGLFKAVRDYSEDKNARFKSFATLCIKRQIIDAVRAGNRRKHNALNNFIPLDELVMATTEDPENAILIDEEQKVLTESINNVLSRYEIKILKLFLDRKSYKEIAEIAGKDIKSIDNALQRIKRKIKDIIK
ncbi:MAG: sigma-70 family RNA polymerase sigma factor [Christensenellales bacterium]|jgi:RNA polymerase sporulation-specific sigma factor